MRIQLGTDSNLDESIPFTTQSEANPNGTAVKRHPPMTSTKSEPLHEECYEGYNVPPRYTIESSSSVQNLPFERQGFSNASYFGEASYEPYLQNHFQQDSNPTVAGYICDLIPDRAAVWKIKKADLRISALAAAVLLKEEILNPKDITLLQPPTNNTDRDLMAEVEPPDPITGVVRATSQTVFGIFHGLNDYPVEISRMIQSDKENARIRAISFALDSSKGVSGMVGTALRAPMDFTVNISQGFNNLPKVYGDSTVRPVENVTGFQSGAKAAGKGFCLGLWDGISGLVTQPLDAVREHGPGGFMGGVGKGIGGVVCKPAAGAVGLPGYVFKGIHEEVRKLRGVSAKPNTIYTEMSKGMVESETCTANEYKTVLSKWYQLQDSKVR